MWQWVTDSALVERRDFHSAKRYDTTLQDKSQDTSKYRRGMCSPSLPFAGVCVGLLRRRWQSENVHKT